MKRVIYFILVVVCLTGCGSSKSRPGQQINTTVKDSTVTEIKYQKRDTVITIPGDTIRFKVPVREITRSPKTITTDKGSVTISKNDDDTLDIDCITNEMERLIELQDEIRQTLRTIETDKQKTIVVPERYTPWLTKILAGIGGIALLFITIKFFKP